MAYFWQGSVPPASSGSAAEWTPCSGLLLGTHQRFGLHVSFAPYAKPAACSPGCKHFCSYRNLNQGHPGKILNQLWPQFTFLGRCFPIAWCFLICPITRFVHFYFHLWTRIISKHFNFSLCVSYMRNFPPFFRHPLMAFKFLVSSPSFRFLCYLQKCLTCGGQ